MWPPYCDDSASPASLMPSALYGYVAPMNVSMTNQPTPGVYRAISPWPSDVASDTTAIISPSSLSLVADQPCQ